MTGYKELAARLRYLVSLNEPESGGPYGGYAIEALEADRPQFTGVAKQKLDDLIARGWQISGYAITKDGLHGLVTTGGFVGWWSVADANVQAAEAHCKRLEEALTPSGATKAAYIGEFQFPMEIWDPDGGEDGEGEVAIEHVTVPWTTIKQIMATISARARLALQENTNGG